MFQPAVFFEMGKARSGTALFPFSNTLTINSFRFSTRNGNAIIKWGDNTQNSVVPSKNVDSTINTVANLRTKNYATSFTGDILAVLERGLKDVYSIFIEQNVNSVETNKNKNNIQDFGSFIKQFTNLYSFKIDVYATQRVSEMSIIKGDLADIPASVERILFSNFEVVNGTIGDAYFNFNSLPSNSNLKWFRFYPEILSGATNIMVLGNLANLPTTCNHFYLRRCTGNSAITYTAGKVWASSFDTLNIPLPLTTAELDNLLIDMNNSITTKIGDGIIALRGYRSSTSDSAVASLQAKGFTVNVSRGYQILNLPFQNNFTDSGEMAMTMVAGGTSNEPTFALSGRKAGEYCAVFNGSQSIKTTTNLPINSDKVTIAFWMKTTQTAAAIVAEMSENTNSNNTFGVFINNSLSNRVDIADHTTSPAEYNVGSSSVNINNGNWFHVVLTIDRNLGITQNQIYINGSLSYTQNASYVANLVGNFVNNILYIGQRGGSTAGFNGSLTRLKIYNYPFTASEVSNLYNSEL